MRIIVSLLVCLPFSAVACQPPTDSSSSQSGLPAIEAAVTEESVAPKSDTAEVAVAIADFEKLQETIAKYADQIVVVDVWSTSCAPCMHEFPNLVALSRKYPKQVVCISFNVDYIGLKSKPPEVLLPKAQDFLQKQKANIVNLMSATPDEEVLRKLDIESIPAILIYDAQGQMQHKLTDANAGDDGLTYAGDVLPKVERLLNPK